jgi:hypothetical protein
LPESASPKAPTGVVVIKLGLITAPVVALYVLTQLDAL